MQGSFKTTTQSISIVISKAKQGSSRGRMCAAAVAGYSERLCGVVYVLSSYDATGVQGTVATHCTHAARRAGPKNERHSSAPQKQILAIVILLLFILLLPQQEHQPV